jgi:hypothetical protein
MKRERAGQGTCSCDGKQGQRSSHGWPAPLSTAKSTNVSSSSSSSVPPFPAMPAPFSSHVQQHPLPALYLYPLNDSFIPKHIHLPQGQRIKIGRQTNAKTAPGERNGFFDSKVLSRQHAEVWEESGKVRPSSAFLPFLPPSSPSRSTLKTSRVQTVLLSTVKGSARKVQNRSRSSSRPVTLSYVPSIPSWACALMSISPNRNLA